MHRAQQLRKNREDYVFSDSDMTNKLAAKRRAHKGVKQIKIDKMLFSCNKFKFLSFFFFFFEQFVFDFDYLK